jgi:two-component system chemotaxis sensor kinase CheA
MKTGMQPIANLCNKLPRLVRDVAAACGREVRLEMEGIDTELDRTVIEAIRDPLTHLVRNAIDHGIETPDVRVAKGKSAEGRLLVRAFHEGGKVVLEVTDDGGGLSVERIRERGLKAGLVPPERVPLLTDRDWIHLIFTPGFSTAEKVTSVSGRGVGMDVVKTNVERIGGTIEVDSTPGKGSTMRICIPLTLAIVPALIVAAGGERYAIPQVNLLELLRTQGDAGENAIAKVYDAQVYRYRDTLLPLVFLHDALQIEGAVQASLTESGHAALNIAVLHAEGCTFGIVVDEILSSQEIVVKALVDSLRQTPVFSGATILGDGRVALILDAPGLARRCGVGATGAARGVVPMRTALEPETQTQTFVLFRIRDDRWVAIPLSDVARLEELPRAAVERGGRPKGGSVSRRPDAADPAPRTLRGNRRRDHALRVDSLPFPSGGGARGGRGARGSGRRGDSGAGGAELRDRCRHRPARRHRLGRHSGARHRRSRYSGASGPGRDPGFRFALDGGGSVAMAEDQLLCTFRLAGHLIGIEISAVQEVLRQQEITRLPLASPAVRGVINLRGRIVPAIDLRRCFDMEPAVRVEASPNIVVRGGTTSSVAFWSTKSET